jgi:hypothetical protein
VHPREECALNDLMQALVCAMRPGEGKRCGIWLYVITSSRDDVAAVGFMSL